VTTKRITKAKKAARKKPPALNDNAKQTTERSNLMATANAKKPTEVAERRQKRDEAYLKLNESREEIRGAGDGDYAVSSRERNYNETPEKYAERTGATLQGEPPPTAKKGEEQEEDGNQETQ
jgi:hypothetical protein